MDLDDAVFAALADAVAARLRSAPAGTRDESVTASDPQAASPEVHLQPLALTVDELAVLLRVNCKTAYSAISAGEIPGVRRVGGVIRIHRDAVLGWLAQGQGRVSRSRRKNP